MNYTFEARADGAAVPAKTRSAPINGSFLLVDKLVVKSVGKPIYNASKLHKVVFINIQLDFSDDYVRSVAKSHF